MRQKTPESFYTHLPEEYIYLFILNDKNMIGYMEEHSEVNMVKSERPASPRSS